MKTTADFLDRLTKAEGIRILDLLDRAFGDDVYSANTRNAFFRGYQSEFPNVVLLHSENDLAGLAILGTRIIALAGAQIYALTVGPIAIDPRFQNRGLSALLMAGIDELAADLGASVIYLVGIPGFYHLYGYYPLLSRTKVTLKMDAIQSCRGVEVHPYSERYLPEIINLFRINAQMNSCASTRSERDWEWLTRYACDTYYFFKPQVVRSYSQVVGYFCSDAREPGRVREAVYAFGDEEINSFLNGVKEFFAIPNPATLEIMTPANSPLHRYVREGLDATFTEIIQGNGGQLLKICDEDQLLSKVRAASARALNHGSHPSQSGFSPQVDAEWLEGGLESFSAERLPGVLSGYHRRVGQETQYSASAGNADVLVDQLSRQTPFIYQGDNY